MLSWVIAKQEARMKVEEKLARQRLSILKLAEALQVNVSKAVGSVLRLL